MGDSDPSPGRFNCNSAHGMATAGLIAASQNTLGITGIAPIIKIMPLKIADDSAKITRPSNVAKAIEHANFYGAYIASNSWSSCADRCTKALCDTLFSSGQAIRFNINFATERGTLFIFSGGNFDSCVSFPANLKSVLAVGATNKYDVRSSYSPRIQFGGDSLDLVAPSGSTKDTCYEAIWTLDIMGSYNWCCPFDPPANNNYITRFTGTSAACPQVAGTAALVISYARKSNFRTNLVLNDYKKIIRFSTDDKGPVGWDASYGQGRLNAMKAMVEVARGDVVKDGRLLLTDIVFLTNYIFNNGPAPTPLRSLGDVNCDGSVNIVDQTYLVNRVFKGGPPPAIHCYRFY